MNTSILPTNTMASFKAVSQMRDLQNMDTEQLRILVVEDEPISQRVSKLTLKNIGYQVDIAGTGKSALELFANNNYAAILMDMGLPDITGVDVTKRMRELEQTRGIYTPIIALTAHGPFAKKDCLAAGMDDFFTKPLEIETLGKLLTSWIEKSN